MNTTIKSKLLCSLFLFILFNCNAQIEDYEYRAKIKDASIGWNSINIPIDFFSYTANNLHDIRIFHRNPETGEEIEQPYIFDIQTAETKFVSQSPKIINQTSQNDIFSYTFELTNKMTVNNITLNFKNQNFDWKIKLEGSMNLNSWATIVDDYRITSFRRDGTAFKLTDLTIPESKFNFYKISFQAEKQPILESVGIIKKEITVPNYRIYNGENTNRIEDKKSKTSIIEVDLGRKKPIDQLEFTTDYSNDFYRLFKVEGLIDSFATEKGWKYNYKHLYSGTINSFNEDVFKFKSQIVSKLKITVYNYDDQPIPLFKFIPKGPNYRLITKLDETENLFLVYGNELSTIPKYDITYFDAKIPEKLTEAVWEDPLYYPKSKEDSVFNFKNKWWLWGIMILVIFILGSFTIKMLKEN